MNPRQKMVEEIKTVYGLKDAKVLFAMLKIPREEFVPPNLQYLAYNDGPVAIGYGQTISQPYTVAFMTHLLDLSGNERVLEIGTGSGYQAAVLSHLAKEVYTIERILGLAKEARKRLKKLGFKNVFVKAGQGEMGWPEAAPFDAMIVTAGVEEVPRALFNQLKDRGILVVPVGSGMDKKMVKFVKKGKKITKKQYGIFHFVPFIETP